MWWLHLGWISRWGRLCVSFPSVSALLFAPLFPLDRNNSGLKFCRCVCGPIPQLGGGIPNLWIWYQQILPPDSRIFQLMSPCGFLGCSWFPGIWDSLVATQRTHPWLLYTSVQFLDLCTHLPSSTIPDSSPISPSPCFLPLRENLFQGCKHTSIYAVPLNAIKDKI